MDFKPLITPIPIIDRTGTSINVLQALITAGFAVLSGFILYLLKCIVDGCWLRHLRKYKELKAEIEYVLELYANAYMNVSAKGDAWHDEASREIRNIGARMGAFAIERPIICLFVPKKYVLSKVSKELLGISNRTLQIGEKALYSLEVNDESRRKIRELLRIKNPA